MRGGLDVGFGSLIAAARSSWDVRFTPESELQTAVEQCPLWANTGLMHGNKVPWGLAENDTEPRACVWSRRSRQTGTVGGKGSGHSPVRNTFAKMPGPLGPSGPRLERVLRLYWLCCRRMSPLPFDSGHVEPCRHVRSVPQADMPPVVLIRQTSHSVKYLKLIKSDDVLSVGTLGSPDFWPKANALEGNRRRN